MCVALLLAACANQSTKFDETTAETRSLVPVGAITIDVMDLMAPARLLELTHQLQEAIERNPRWMAEHVANTLPGEPLPYHSNLGMSEAEYQEFLKLVDEVSFGPVAENEISIVEVETSIFEIDGGEMLSRLTGVRIDLNKNQVHTSFGTAATMKRIEPSSGQQPSPWSGISWGFESIDTSTLVGTSMQFSLGRLLKNGNGILYYDAKHVDATGARDSVTYVLVYEVL